MQGSSIVGGRGIGLSEPPFILDLDGVGRGLGDVSGERFDWLGDHESFERRSLLALPSKAKPGKAFLALGILGISAREAAPGVQVRHEGRGATGDGDLDGADVGVRGQDALCVLAPGGDRAFGLGGLAEDEPDEDVQAADGEEEEG